MHMASDRGQSQQVKGSFFTTSNFLVHLTRPLMFYVMRWRKLYLVRFFLGRVLYLPLRNALIYWLKVTGMFLLCKSDWKIYQKWRMWSRREARQQRDSRRLVRLNEDVSRLHPIKASPLKSLVISGLQFLSILPPSPKMTMMAVQLCWRLCTVARISLQN